VNDVHRDRREEGFLGTSLFGSSVRRYSIREYPFHLRRKGRRGVKGKGFAFGGEIGHLLRGRGA